MVLWLGLVLLAFARAALSAWPTMSGWGLDLLRFVAPGFGWTAWTLAALALIPPLSRGPAALLGRAADRARTVPWVAYPGVGAAAAALVLLNPDRVRFVGDFLLRFGTAERALEPAALFPQALPLDVLLHYTLPRALADAFAIDVASTARALGALEAGLLACLGVAFARALDLSGMVALAAAGTVFFGGALGMYTGYGKAMAEMALLTAGCGLFAIRSLSDARSLLPLGVVVAGALTLHRSALGLLPVLAFAWVRAPRTGVAWRAPRPWLALGIPALALAVLLPRIVATILAWDSVHFLSPEVRSHGGPLRAMFAGPRGLDLVNLLVLLSPITPAVWAAAPALGRRALASSGTALLVLAAPWLVAALFVHGSQGMFRDWDNFAAAGLATSLVSAWLVGETLRRAPRWEWLGLAVLLGAAAPTTQWLVHNADLPRGLERIEAFLREPPSRGPTERGTTWDFLGIRYAQLLRWDESAAALAHAAETSPSPRVLLQWAMAEQARGDERTAQRVYRRAAAVAPTDPRAWFGLAVTSLAISDFAQCRRAALALDRLNPGDPDVPRLLEQAARMEGQGAQPRP
ncbi:MAG: hypothetical protein E6K78_03380 [Candidatus Eisenbacteria bacterium]|uniref:Tetratricopeptide repeat protein n=1 Tax=Eiseniibacteriota bacterium TaxID=2212470 RepID=A0A538TW61_UNCEI|nr:MAG: hypothetical protein E6K78_03380 [Candidatus Eisenbacteria bacterium]